MKLKQKDSLEFLKEQSNNSADIIFCDPPYALGSEVIIRPDGKPDYKKATDFMSKWKMPTGEYWEDFFKEAFRALKYGGYCLMYSIDRQNFLFKYYAHLAGFKENQSLYWFQVQNFPKSADLSKMIDKHFGAEREVVGKGRSGNPQTHKVSYNMSQVQNNTFGGEYIITKSSTTLAKKYNGYKYSQAPLKQVVEEIMVFQKPYKTGSCLHDVLAMENGDEEITCGALDIENNRVGTTGGCNHGNKPNEDGYVSNPHNIYGKYKPMQRQEYGGRYPTQMFIQCICDEVIKQKSGTPYIYRDRVYEKSKNAMFRGDKPQAPSDYNDKGEIHTNPNCPCAKLDRQSGVSKSTGGRIGNKGSMLNMCGTNYKKGDPGYGDTGGASKILHKIKYYDEEVELLMYNPKVSKKERQKGIGDYYMLKSEAPKVIIEEIKKALAFE